MCAMVQEARPELSHEQAREMAVVYSRGQPPVAAPPVDHFPALAPPPFVPPPLPMAPPRATTLRIPASPGPFEMEPPRDTMGALATSNTTDAGGHVDNSISRGVTRVLIWFWVLGHRERVRVHAV